MKIKGLHLLLAASFLAGALSAGETAHAILISGNTNSSSPTTIDVFLTYTSATFTNVSVPVGPGATSLANLGKFTLNVCGGNNCSENFGTQDGVTDFTLRINFTDPIVSGSPVVFAADIFGTINRSGNSTNIGNGSLLTIDFDNSIQHLIYSNALGSGAFDLSVNDPATYTGDSQFGDIRIVTGQIANLTFAPSAVAAVPEPASLLLFAAGLAGIPILRRKGRRDGVR